MIIPSKGFVIENTFILYLFIIIFKWQLVSIWITILITFLFHLRNKITEGLKLCLFIGDDLCSIITMFGLSLGWLPFN